MSGWRKRQIMEKQMTKDEALRLALEALGWTDEWRPQGLKEEAITAIKAALEAKDKPFMASYEHKQYGYYKDESGSLKLGDIPQRTWVKLTNEQYLKACKMAEGGNYMVAFQRIQQWLKEKNT